LNRPPIESPQQNVISQLHDQIDYKEIQRLAVDISSLDAAMSRLQLQCERLFDGSLTSTATNINPTHSAAIEIETRPTEELLPQSNKPTPTLSGPNVTCDSPPTPQPPTVIPTPGVLSVEHQELIQPEPISSVSPIRPSSRQGALTRMLSRADEFGDKSNDVKAVIVELGRLDSSVSDLQTITDTILEKVTPTLTQQKTESSIQNRRVLPSDAVPLSSLRDSTFSALARRIGSVSASVPRVAEAEEFIFLRKDFEKLKEHVDQIHQLALSAISVAQTRYHTALYSLINLSYSFFLVPSR
jgi:hypothetical protein